MNIDIYRLQTPNLTFFCICACIQNGKLGCKNLFSFCSLCTAVIRKVWNHFGLCFGFWNHDNCFRLLTRLKYLDHIFYIKKHFLFFSKHFIYLYSFSVLLNLLFSKVQITHIFYTFSTGLWVYDLKNRCEASFFFVNRFFLTFTFFN